MVALNGTKEVGEGINKVIGRLADANDYLLKGVIDQVAAGIDIHVHAVRHFPGLHAGAMV